LRPQSLCRRNSPLALQHVQLVQSRLLRPFEKPLQTRGARHLDGKALRALRRDQEVGIHDFAMPATTRWAWSLSQSAQVQRCLPAIAICAGTLSVWRGGSQLLRFGETEPEVRQTSLLIACDACDLDLHRLDPPHQLRQPLTLIP
jgi:hypothetical protein